LPPERREAGVVFQHMSVATNLRFGMRRVASGTVRFDDVIDLLGFAALLDRRPHTLSGGERQRVAIGRALLAQPHLLLMDEPLAGLDAARKAEILRYLTRLKTALNLPVLYVTHAMDEAAELAGSLVLVDGGHVVAHGTVSEVAARADLPLALRDDAGALLMCQVAENDAFRSLTRLEGSGATFWVPLLDRPVGSGCRIRVPAREVILAGRGPDAISLHNVVRGTVHRIAADPPRRSGVVELGLPDGGLLSRVTPDAVARLALVPGSPILVLIKSTSIEVWGE
jgi:molybdate transport system ATP-binding protein